MAEEAVAIMKIRYSIFMTNWLRSNTVAYSEQKVLHLIPSSAMGFFSSTVLFNGMYDLGINILCSYSGLS